MAAAPRLQLVSSSKETVMQWNRFLCLLTSTTPQTVVDEDSDEIFSLAGFIDEEEMIINYE